jgi:hypothetical protein
MLRFFDISARATTEVINQSAGAARSRSFENQVPHELMYVLL